MRGRGMYNLLGFSSHFSFSVQCQIMNESLFDTCVTSVITIITIITIITYLVHQLFVVFKKLLQANSRGNVIERLSDALNILNRNCVRTVSSCRDRDRLAS
jgi:hypothetical protein